MTLFGGIAATLTTVALRIPFRLQGIWPYLLGTVIAHALYFSGLSRVYQGGALGDAYPATRGLGIAGTAGLGWLLWGQRLAGLTLLGVIGIAVLVAWPALKARWSLRTIVWAILVGAAIALYSTIDNHGVRLVSPVVYIACQFLGTALVLTPIALREKRTVGIVGPAAVGGLFSVGSYLLILFAYRVSAAAPVLALRQISIAAAPFVGWLMLKEPIPRQAPWIALGIAVGALLVVLH
nr:EamA family transporter [Sulfobacillus harzensis]